MNRRASVEAWISTIGQAVGLAFLIAFGVVWIASNRVEPLLVSTAGLLYSAGKAGEARAILRRSPPTPPPIPDSSPSPPAPPLPDSGGT